VAEDGESNWLEGLMLLMLYAILALAFFFLPERASKGRPGDAGRVQPSSEAPGGSRRTLTLLRPNHQARQAGQERFVRLGAASSSCSSL
jgi:hypothetical protein